MLNILYNYLLGTVEDNIHALVFPQLINGLGTQQIAYVGYPYGFSFDLIHQNEPLFNLIFFCVSYLVRNTIITYNLFVVVTYMLIFFSAYTFYKSFFHNKVVPLILSTIFIFNPYIAYQARSHLALLQIWLVILFLYLYLFREFKFKVFVLGLLLTITAAASNYLGYILIILLGVLVVSSALVHKGINIEVRKQISTAFLILTVAGISSLTFLYPYIKNNYIIRNTKTEVAQAGTLARPIDDFVLFSSRPWYFVLPSVDNPIWGNTTRTILDTLETKWGHYLTFNYFKSEHSSVYLGFISLLLAIAGAISTLKSSTNNKDRKMLFTLGITGVLLALLTFPPYVIISGKYIYTPSYLLYLTFPMFRVLSRFGFVITLIELIFTGYGISLIQYKISKTKLRYPVYVVITLLAISEFFIPLKITKVLEMPKVFRYIKDYTPEQTVIATFPYDKNTEAFFWLKDYKRNYINVPGAFAKNLASDEGLLTAKSLTPDYLVYFYKADPNSEENLKFFDTAKELKKVGVFDSDKPEIIYKGPLVQINDIGNVKDNSAILYEFIK